MRGRKPKPTEVKIIKGTFQKCRANPREIAVRKYLGDPPDHLSDLAKQIWLQAVDDAPKNLLKKIDGSIFEIWVVACAAHRECQRILAEQGILIEDEKKGLVPNAILRYMNQQAMIIAKAAAEMGFTPSSRSRVQAEDDVEVDNPWSKLANGS